MKKQSMTFLILLFVSIIVVIMITVIAIPSFSIGNQPMIVHDKSLVINKIAENMNSPSSLVFIDNDILITQKYDGKVRLVKDSILKKYPIGDVDTFGKGFENGLKGIASGNRNNITYIFLLFAESSNKSTNEVKNVGIDYKIYRYIWNSTGLKLEDKTLILTLPAKVPVNTGGKLIVGPDNQLYITIGDLDMDGKEQNTPRENNFFDIFLNNNIKSGAILRINFDGFPSDDNPFSESGFERYFAYGIRNSLGLAFDPVTRYLWDTEQGPGAADEINLVKPGFNSGWNSIQGFSNTTCCTDDLRTFQNIFKLFKVKGSHYDEPKAVFKNSPKLTGITFQYTDALGPNNNNSLFVGDMMGNIYKFDLSKKRDYLIGANNLSDSIFAKGFGPISDLKVGPNGNLYVLTYSDNLKYPFNKNTGTMYIIKNANSSTELSENDRIDIELTALFTTFTILSIILISVWLFPVLRKSRKIKI
jgi:glucose/arabinose dehydrogenase